MARDKTDNFDWNQLKGKDFLGQRKGGMPQMAGEFTLKKHGIHPQQDLKLIQNVDFANIAPAFVSGTGQYVQLFEPQASIFEKEGKGHVVASFGVESGPLPYTVFMSKQSYIKKNADTVQKFTNALQKAQIWVAQHKPEEIADAILPYFKNTERDIIVSAVKRYQAQGTYAPDAVLDDAEWNNLLNVMTQAGELKKTVPLSAIVDNQFADKAKATVK